MKLKIVHELFVHSPLKYFLLCAIILILGGNLFPSVYLLFPYR